MIYSCECRSLLEAKGLCLALRESTATKVTLDYVATGAPTAKERSAVIRCIASELGELIRTRLTAISLSDPYKGSPLRLIARGIGLSTTLGAFEYVNNAIDEPGEVHCIADLSSAAAQCSTLHTFMICNGLNFGSESAAIVADRLVRRSLTLRKLSVANNHDREKSSDMERPIGAAAVGHIMRACCDSPILRSLYLYGTGLTPSDAAPLRELATTAVALRDLRFRYWARQYENAYIGHPQLDDKPLAGRKPKPGKTGAVAASPVPMAGPVDAAPAADLTPSPGTAREAESQLLPNTKAVMAALRGADRWRNACRIAGITSCH